MGCPLPGPVTSFLPSCPRTPAEFLTGTETQVPVAFVS